MSQYMASDGKSLPNRPAMKRHERSIGRMASKSEGGGAGMSEHVDPLKQPGEGEEQDGHAIAQEHGPAHEVHIQHNEESGEHQVVSMHPDGHQHSSMHPTKEAAHEHGQKCAGCGMEDEMGNQDEDAEPEYE